MHVGRHTTAQLRFTPLVFICQRTPFCTLLYFQRMCHESGIKDEGTRNHPGAREGFLFVSLVGKASVLLFRKLLTCPAQAQRKKSW